MPGSSDITSIIRQLTQFRFKVNRWFSEKFNFSMLITRQG